MIILTIVTRFIKTFPIHLQELPYISRSKINYLFTNPSYLTGFFLEIYECIDKSQCMIYYTNTGLVGNTRDK